MLAAQRGNEPKRLSLFKSLVRSGASWYLVVSRRVFIKYRYEYIQAIRKHLGKKHMLCDFLRLSTYPKFARVNHEFPCSLITSYEKNASFWGCKSRIFRAHSRILSPFLIRCLASPFLMVKSPTCFPHGQPVIAHKTVIFCWLWFFSIYSKKTGLPSGKLT